MEEIAQQSLGRRIIEKSSAGFTAVYEAVKKAGARKIAIVLCPIAVLVIAGSIMFNLKHVDISVAGKVTQVATFSSNLSEILKSGGITTSPYDKIVFSGYSNNYATINIMPAFKVSIKADDKTTDVMIAEGTVSDALAAGKIKVGEEDIVEPSLTAKVQSGDTITVKRVTYETKTNLKSISFATEQQPTTLLRKGVQKLLSEGKSGQSTVKTQIKLIDGVATNQKTVSETLKVKPVSRKLLVGTAAATPVSKLEAPSSLKLNSSGVPSSYSRKYTGLATAYSAHSGALTASGRRAGVGYVAVDPNKIPFGSKLYIMSPNGSYVYGYAIAADTGGFVSNGSGILTDLYFSSYAQSCNFGERTMTIYVLN